MTTPEAKVGVLIVTHGDCGYAMMNSVRTLLGAEALEGFEALAVSPTDPRGPLAERIGTAATRLDRGAGTLIVCDLQGSTAANCSVDLKRQGRNVEVLAGVSLPMLVKLASANRTTTPTQLAKAAAETAQRSIRLGDGGTP